MRRSLLLRLLIVPVVAGAVFWLFPGAPHDQTLIFSLGRGPAPIVRLDVTWESTAGGHEGGFTLNFPDAAPERVVRQVRLADGEYAFHVSARRRGATPERTELTRRVTLNGSTLTLRLEELTE